MRAEGLRTAYAIPPTTRSPTGVQRIRHETMMPPQAFRHAQEDYLNEIGPRAWALVGDPSLSDGSLHV